jgi:hypothetical protein
MSTLTTTLPWITGEEYAREWRRLREADSAPDSPEMESLLRRIDERDEYLWVTHGEPLLCLHPGKWVAISTEGEVILGDGDLEVSEEADRRFGEYNYYVARLDKTRGAPRIGPRAG